MAKIPLTFSTFSKQKSDNKELKVGDASESEEVSGNSMSGMSQVEYNPQRRMGFNSSFPDLENGGTVFSPLPSDRTPQPSI